MISMLKASRFAQEHGLTFYEASAMTGEGVAEVFQKVRRRHACMHACMHAGHVIVAEVFQKVRCGWR